MDALCKRYGIGPPVNRWNHETIFVNKPRRNNGEARLNLCGRDPLLIADAGWIATESSH
jgi:hypothetical protein